MSTALWQPDYTFPLPGEEGLTFRIYRDQPGLSIAAVYNAAHQIVQPGPLKVYNLSIPDTPRENKPMKDNRFLINFVFNYRVTYDNGRNLFDLICAYHMVPYDY